MSTGQKKRLLVAAMDLVKILNGGEAKDGELLTRVASMYYEVGNARRQLVSLT